MTRKDDSLLVQGILSSKLRWLLLVLILRILQRTTCRSWGMTDTLRDRLERLTPLCFRKQRARTRRGTFAVVSC